MSQPPLVRLRIFFAALICLLLLQTFYYQSLSLLVILTLSFVELVLVEGIVESEGALHRGEN